jgi:uncharacterized protein YdhG (YjbR/CyaY superfamily)
VIGRTLTESHHTDPGAPAIAAKPKTIDGYLAALTEDKRAALEKLRRTIHAAVPKAEECISYGLAAFRLNGRPLVAFGATANHCAFFPMSSSTVAAHQDELKGFDTSKGTIRFAADKPLPVALVRKLVKARIAENEGHEDSQRRVTSRGNSQTDAAVVAFLRDLDHPLKSEIEAVRRIILGVSPEIREAIKWNAPSFRTTEFFATFNLRHGRAWLILHTGAKVKADAKKDTKVADPTGLLKWLGKDRCVATFTDGKDVRAKKAALQEIVRVWIRQL